MFRSELDLKAAFILAGLYLAMPELFADTNLIVFGKLALAAFLGFLIGTERAVAGKRAGTRTFALVALGACLFVIASFQANEMFTEITEFDPMRVAAAVVTGVGFLGAGLIIFRDDALRGLTTAASLWVSAAIGVAVGAGLYTMAVFSTVLVLIIFTLVWFVEEWIKRRVAADERAAGTVSSEDS